MERSVHNAADRQQYTHHVYLQVGMGVRRRKYSEQAMHTSRQCFNNGMQLRHYRCLATYKMKV